MKKLIQALTLLPILLFSSCPALNTKPAIAAVGGMEIAFKSSTEAFKKFVSNPNLKIDEEFRLVILAEIEKDSKAFAAMKEAHDAWTNAASSVNVEEVLKRLLMIYKEIMQ